MECDLCFAAPKFVIVFSKGREIVLCDDIYCIGRLPEIAKEEEDNIIHSIEDYEE